MIFGRKLAAVERYIRELESTGDDKHTAWNKSGIKLVDSAKVSNG